MKADPSAADRIQEALASARRLRALVIGDAMVDNSIWGDRVGLSPEAPVPRISWGQEGAAPGGAANVAANLVRLGVATTLIGVIGDDETGGELSRICRSTGIESELLVAPGRPTTRKVRIFGDRSQLLRLDRETREPLDAAAARDLLERCRRRLAAADLVVFSDYEKGVFSTMAVSPLIAECRRRGIVTAAGPKPGNLEDLGSADLVSLNRTEAAEASGTAVNDESSVLTAGIRLVERFRIRRLVVTRGDAGSTLFEKGRSPRHFPTPRVSLGDPCGCGDSLLAAASVVFAAVREIDLATTIGNLAGAAVAGEVGVATADPEEIRSLLHGETPPTEDRLRKPPELPESAPVIRELGELAARCGAWRNQGLRLVTTNGCFDILHAGHLKILQAARERGDRLVVGLNSDESTRRLKGTGRPVIDEDRRAAALASLPLVDLVYVFEESVPDEFLRVARPEIHVKGGDYRIEDLPEAHLVRTLGGRIVILPLVAGSHTTDILTEYLARDRARA